jgi:hypothetical protein
MKSAGLLLLIFLSICTITSAQNSHLFEITDSVTKFIASNYNQKSGEYISDLQKVDLIYLLCLSLNNYDISETLFSSTFASIPYREVPIKIPVLNFEIRYPLISSLEKIFEEKIKCLPKNLMFDSPDDEFGDKDKTAHFFGNAFLAYNTIFFDLTSLFGYFVEVFEETFKISSISQRDLIANGLGNSFGKLLKKDPNILPSSIFLTYNLKLLRVPL